MKINVLILFFMLFRYILDAQTLSSVIPPIDRIDSFKVELYYNYICDSNIERINNFTLSKGDKNYDSKNGDCSVPEPGLYKVDVIGLIQNLENNEIYVSRSFQKDTLNIYKIYSVSKIVIGPHWPITYVLCGSPCEGDVTEYWSNGNLRISGKFKSGKIIKYIKYDDNNILEQKKVIRKFYILDALYKEGILFRKTKKILILGYYKYLVPNSNKYYKKLSFF